MIRLLKYIGKKVWILIVLVIALVITQVFCDLELPTKLTNILTSASRAEALINAGGLTDVLKNECINEIVKNTFEMVIFAFISLFANVVVAFLASKIAADFSYRLRKEVYLHVQKFSISEIERFSTASLITRTTNDITQIQMVVIMVLRMAIAAPTTAILGILKAGNVKNSANLSWIVVISVVCLVTLVTTIFALVLPRFKKIQALTDKLNLVTRENLTGIRVVRANSAQDYQEEKFAKVNTDVTQNNIFINRVLNLMMPGMTIIMNGTSLAILWVGAYIINENPIFLGSVFGFQQITMMIVMAFMQLIMIFIMVPRGLVSARRVWEVLDVQPSIHSSHNIVETKKQGEVEFKNVAFSYSKSSECVLEGINFKVNKGDTVAIIGSTGSGKTSLINLIPRFFDATNGTVLVDGVDVKDYDLKTLRSKIGFIQQKSLLFKGTVESNLKYGKEDATEEEMLEALKLSMAYNFIMNEKEGLQTHVAQGGANFSGGQKQRLSIARALIKKPEILVFDDSFSALDFKTDKVLREELKKLEYNPSKIIVAQRIGTIMDADLIIVLEKGKIVGCGKHNDLIKNCSVYQEIAYSQLSKEEIENA